MDLKKLIDVVSKEVVKNKLNIKINNLGNKFPEATTLVYINQYNTDKQSLDKKIGDVDKKIPGVSGLVTATVLTTKIGEVDNKIPSTSGLVTTIVLDTKIGEVEHKIQGVSGLVKKTDYITLKCQTLRKAKILLLLIIINLRVKYLMQR